MTAGVKRGSLLYNQFSKRDLSIVQRAWEFIQKYDMKTRSAFERANREHDDPQLSLFF